MWIVIILVILLIIINLLFSRSNSIDKNVASKIQVEGGMTKKYSFLVEQFTGSRGKVVRVDKTSIIIEATSIGGTTLIILTHTNGQIAIKWSLDSPVYGKHFQDWEFPEGKDQVKIIESVGEDMKRYNARQGWM